MKPVAGTANASTSRYEAPSASYMRNHRTRNGTTDVASAQRLRGRSGRASSALEGKGSPFEMSPGARSGSVGYRPPVPRTCRDFGPYRVPVGPADAGDVGCDESGRRWAFPTGADARR